MVEKLKLVAAYKVCRASTKNITQNFYQLFSGLIDGAKKCENGQNLRPNRCTKESKKQILHSPLNKKNNFVLIYQ